MNSVSFTEREAWEIVNRSKERVYHLDSEVREKIYSIVLYNSLVRGDFLPDVSDIDIMIVMKTPNMIFPQEEAKLIMDVFDEESKSFKRKAYRGRHHGVAVVDSIAFGEPELPLRGRTPIQTNTVLAPPEIKPLGIYAFDFVKYNKVLFGENFIPYLEVKPPKAFIPERAARMRNRLQDRRVHEPMGLPLIAGEALRLAELYFGEPDLDKRRILTNFMKYVPGFPLQSFSQTLHRQYFDLNYFNEKSDRELEEFYQLCFEFANHIIDLVLDRTD